MTVPTNTYQAIDATGRREDLTDVIYDLTPTDTPFLSAIEAVEARNMLHEWQTDALAAASADNAVIDGDDPSADAATATTRLSNSTQLMDKVAIVSSRQRAIVSAGRRDELAYQVVKRSRELKRDVESALLSNNAEAKDTDGSTAQKMGGIESWLTSNVSRGTSGSNGGTGDTAATDGTARDFTEAMLAAVLQSCWENGGDPSMILVGGFNKRKISENFSGFATRTHEAGTRTIEAASDVYVSDYGWLDIVPSRFSRARSALIVQPDMAAVAYLQPFKLEPLAKSGHSEKRMLSVECTLEMRNQAAHGVAADLTTT
jgi:hypothetical protein